MLPFKLQRTYGRATEPFRYFLYSGLKPNKSKCKTAGISVLKGMPMGLFKMECI